MALFVKKCRSISERLVEIIKTYEATEEEAAEAALEARLEAELATEDPLLSSKCQYRSHENPTPRTDEVAAPVAADDCAVVDPTVVVAAL